MDQVAQIQELLGIADGPYLALHIRTGFLCMKQEEVGHFNPEKNLPQSLRLVEEYDLLCKAGWETPLFLATDSNKVKELAVEIQG